MIRFAVHWLQWAYDVTLAWITVRPEAPLMFTAHMITRSLLTSLKHLGLL